MLAQTVNADLLMSGPGFAVGLASVQISPGEHMVVTISPDGRELTFNTSEQGTYSPSIFVALDSETAAESYIFSVDGIALDADKTVSVALDLEGGKLTFDDNDGGSDTYGLNILRINADGSEEYFANDAIQLGGTSNAALNFGTWDGSESITVEIDGQSQTFEHEEATVNQLFLPLVTR